MPDSHIPSSTPRTGAPSAVEGTPDHGTAVGADPQVSQPGTSAGDPDVSRMHNQQGLGNQHRLRREFLNRRRLSAKPSGGRSPAASAPAADAAPPSATAPGAPHDSNATQPQTHAAGAEPSETAQNPESKKPNANTNNANDANDAEAQLAGQKKPLPPLSGEVSDTTRDDLMQQLGGRKNMDYEGIHQADKLAEDMAKQSAKWGNV